MNPFFVWLESTSFSVWMRESPSVFAFPVILAFHTIGMGLVAGINAAVALRLLGLGAGIPTIELRRFMPIMWFGFWLNAASGVALLIGYPTKALTNPVFYLKLTLVAAALVILRSLGTRLTQPDLLESDAKTTRMLAMASLACWAGAITAGRLLAYTYSRLMADF